MKRLDLPLALALLLAVPISASPARAVTPHAERSDQVVDATGLSAIELHNTRGLVKLRPSTDGKLHVAAIKICRLQRSDDVAKYMAQTTVVSRSEGGRWVVRVNYPRRIESRIDFWKVFTEHSGGLEFPLLEVQLLVDAPPGWGASVVTASGDVDVTGMSGPLDLRSTSGDIAVANAPGVTRVSSTSGEVELVGVGRTTVRTTSGDTSIDGVGALSAESTSGEISVDGALDSLRLTSSSGDLRVSQAPRGVRATTQSGEIEVRGAAGVVRVSSRSGDVDLALASGLRRCDAETTSGSLDASLDPGLSASLRLQTTSGSLESRAPLRTQSQDHRHLTATFGRGGVPVTLQTVSGDIHLSSGGN